MTIANGRMSPWTVGAGHKTLDYWSRIHALQEAAAVRAGEALWLMPDANIACGSVSNVFIVKDDALLTPPARTETHNGEPSPVLPGITRSAVLELAAGRRIERRPISVDELLAADEMFMTNSSWQILPVTSLPCGPHRRRRRFGSRPPDAHHRRGWRGFDDQRSPHRCWL